MATSRGRHYAFAEMSWLVRAAIVIAALAGIAPGMLAARWYGRTYFQRTGYHPFPLGACGFALESEREASFPASPTAPATAEEIK